VLDAKAYLVVSSNQTDGCERPIEHLEWDAAVEHGVRSFASIPVDRTVRPLTPLSELPYR
jgi:hypothetical protein